MSDQILTCAGCDKHMATLRDAKVRTGMVVYCSECNRKLELCMKRELISRMKNQVDESFIPDFLRGFMGKKS